MPVALVFPGQGSQVVGMGYDFYTDVPAARTVFDHADAELGISLSQLCFLGPEEHLTATEHAQPALLTMSIAILRTIETMLDSSRTLTAMAVAGHSLGEYSALVAAGGCDFPAALRLVRRRGELMAAAREGTMAAVMGIEEERLADLCRQVSARSLGVDQAASVVIANYNAPGQLVVSGSTDAVQEVLRLAKEQGARRTLPLNVSAGFHSPLMHAAAEGLRPAIETASIHDLHTPLVGNVTAESLHSAADVRRELIAQIASPVRWSASVLRMIEMGIDTFVEIGPGKVLSGLIRRIAPQARCFNAGTLAETHVLVDALC
jgi:[acyl-carrier-protein] S-malonyltransferase